MSKFGPKNWGTPNWLKFCRGIHCYMFITILTFLLSKCLSFILFWVNLVPKPEVLQIDWNLIRGTLLYAYYDFNICFSKIFVTNVFLGRCGPIIWISSKWLKFRREVHGYMLITVLMFTFPKLFSFIFFGKTCSQNLKFSKLTE